MPRATERLGSHLIKACHTVTSRIKIQRLVDQRHAVKLCVKLNKSASETLGMINEAYGGKAMSRMKVSHPKKVECDSVAHHIFDPKCVVHSERLPCVQSVTEVYYTEACDKETNASERRSLITKFFTTTTPSHHSLVVQETLAKIGIATLPQPPCNPDVAPPDSFLFPKIKRSLKERPLGTVSVRGAVDVERKKLMQS